MAVVPTAPNFASEQSSADKFNQLRDCIRFLESPPRAELRQLTVQTVTTATWTVVNFDGHEIDTDVDGVAGHSDTVNNPRWTCRYPGLYELAGGVCFTVNATGNRGTHWAVNSTAVPGSETMFGAIATLVHPIPARTKKVTLAVGDYVELRAWQSSGGNLDTYVGGIEDQSTMTIKWVSL